MNIPINIAKKNVSNNLDFFIDIVEPIDKLVLKIKRQLQL